jgi:hypothetical protein
MVSKYLTVSLVVVIIVVVLMGNVNCASIFDGPKRPLERSDNIMWGYVVLDVFLTGCIGLIIDLADGAIYFRTSISSDIEKDMRTHLAKHIPVYKVTDNKIYSVTLSNNGALCYAEIAKESLPPRVVVTIEKQMK